MKKNIALFCLLLFLTPQFSYAQEAQPVEVKQEENKEEIKSVFDDFSNQELSSDTIMKPKFQLKLSVALSGWRYATIKDSKLKQEIFYLDKDKKPIGNCTLSDGLCELDLKNKEIKWTSWYFGILLGWKPFETIIPFDVANDKNSTLDYAANKTVHTFSNIEIIIREKGTWEDEYEFVEIKTYSSKTGGSEDDKTIDTGNSWAVDNKISWIVDPKLGIGYVQLINSDGKVLAWPYNFKADENWVYYNGFEFSVKKSMFEVGRNYTIVFQPDNPWILPAGITKTYTSFNSFLSEFDNLQLIYTPLHQRYVEASFPFFKLGILWLIFFLFVFGIRKYFIEGLAFLRGDRTQVWKIVD